MDAHIINVTDLFKKLAQGFHAEPDYSKWTQVGKLTPEEITKYKVFDSWIDRVQRESKVLMKKLEAIKAEAELKNAEWWDMLHKNHSLPDETFHITDDHRILMKPKEKKNA